MPLDRRQFIRRAALFGGGAALTAAGAATGVALAPAPSSTAQRFHTDDLVGTGGQTVEKFYRFKFVDQPIMDAQTLFFLSQASQGGADIGEVLGTALTIQSGDEVSWFEAWSELATRIQSQAEDAHRDGRERTAAAHYRRAGTYWRAGLMRYARKQDPRLNRAVHEALGCHGHSLDLLGYDHDEIEIPYEGSRIYGRWYRSPHARGPAPTLLLMQGLHAWPEDTMWVVDEALARGYHVLGFHAPGQGATLRLHGLAYRHDWEHPIATVVDHALAQPWVDASRLSLMGLSFGGHLVVRAAAFEHRLSCIIANPGAANWARLMMQHLEGVPGLMSLYHRSPAGFDGAVQAIGTTWPDASWYFEDACWKHGVERPHELIAELQKFDATALVPKIKSHILIMEGAAEDVTPGQGQVLHQMIPDRSTYMFFEHGSGAETHCQAGGFILAQMRLFDWLDVHLAGRR